MIVRYWLLRIYEKYARASLQFEQAVKCKAQHKYVGIKVMVIEQYDNICRIRSKVFHTHKKETV